MNRRFIIIALLVFLAGIGGILYLSREFQSVSSPSPTEKELAAKYSEITGLPGQSEIQTQAVLVPIKLSQPVRLAVGGLGFEDNDSNRRLGDLVTAKLTGTPGFELVERQSLDKILQELNLSWSGFVRAKDIVRAGKLLQVDWFLVGTEAKINETNSLVVRVVDARTGVMRDAGVFPADQSSMQLAEDLAAFLRQTRENAAQAKIRVYLAVGAFEDLSVNDRQADFPQQVSGYLTAAYHGSGVTLLERDYVETLLREVHLDMAGLTDSTNSPAVMQSAFWLVSGEYQSYETTNFQVEVKLDVSRIFGSHWTMSLRGLPGDPVGRQIKSAIDGVMARNAGAIAPYRASEERIQMEIGKDLFMAGPAGSYWSPDGHNLVWLNDNWIGDAQLIVRHKRITEEAMQAFETSLLLSPTNRAAKMYLAACLRRNVIFRLDEARSYYREIIDEPVQDKWTGLAEQALPLVMGYSSAEERFRWFNSAAMQTTNLQAAAYYRQQAGGAAADITVGAGGSPEGDQIAEQRLFECLHSRTTMLKGKGGSDVPYMGMNTYVKYHGWKPVEAAQKLSELLPKMEAKEPELRPYILASVLTFQTDTNTPLVAEFQDTLNDLVEHPENTLDPASLWNDIRWSAYQWCLEKTNYSLAIQIIESEQKAAAGGRVPLLDFDDLEKIKLAYLYLAVYRWLDALNVFEAFHNRSFQAAASGPWGKAFQPVLTGRLADYCRKQLGLAVAQDPKVFDIGKPAMCLCSPSTFLADDHGLWVGIAGRLLHLNFDLQTNLDVALPVDESVPITALCVTPSKIWIGTQGAGLVGFDNASRKCERLTQADGLLMDSVSSLVVSGGSLWIGYARSMGGGLGKLDLQSHKLTSFVPGLDGTSPSDNAPRTGVGNLKTDAKGDLWMSAGNSVRVFHETGGVWEVVPTQAGNWGTCFDLDGAHLAEAGGVYLEEIEISTKPSQNAPADQVQKTNLFVPYAEANHLAQSFRTNKAVYQWISAYRSGGIRPRGALAVQNLGNHQWQYLEDAEAIPNPPGIMTLAGNDLWIGGEGVIALVDLNTGKVRKYCHIKATSVDRIQIAGGYIWAQFDWHLYRFPLANL